MQTHGSINKSPIKLSAVENKFTWWFVYEWRKPTQQKPHRVILRSPLPRIHYYQKKQLRVKKSQYLIPTYSWTLTLIPNWTFCSDNLSFSKHISQYVTNQLMCKSSMRLNHQLEKDVGYKFFQFITWWRSWSSLVTKPYGVQTQQLLQEKYELGHISLVHNMLVKNFCIELHQLWRP